MLTSAKTLVLTAVVVLAGFSIGPILVGQPTQAAIPLELTMCRAAESVVFSCNAGKTYSVCASNASQLTAEALHYRAGAAGGHVESEYPGSSTVRPNFRFLSSKTEHSEQRQLSWSEGGYTYTILSLTNSRDSWRNYSGIAISEGERVSSFRTCRVDIDELRALEQSSLPPERQLILPREQPL